MRRLILLPLFALTAVACAPAEEMAEPAEEPAATTEADAEAIQALYAAYGQAVTSGDAETWLAIFTDDVVIMPPDGIVITKHGRKLARLIPYRESSAELIGALAKKIKVSGDLLSTGVLWNAE